MKFWFNGVDMSYFTNSDCIFLAMHYKSDANLAFASIDYISREVQYG